MIVVAATLKAVEGKGDALEQEFKKLAPKVLKDPGTIAYALHRSVDDPNKFFVYEKYQDRDALKMHSQTQHFKDFSRAIGPLLSGRAEISLYNEIS
jgi:quinol monooxygenase YgiN